MSNKSERTIEQIHAEMDEAEATIKRLRFFLRKAMRKIQSKRWFKPYVVNDEGKKVRNTAFKDVREYEATIRSVTRHMVALRQEEIALLKTASEESPYSEFKVETCTTS
jgi:hypothetical protein